MRNADLTPAELLARGQLGRKHAELLARMTAHAPSLGHWLADRLLPAERRAYPGSYRLGATTAEQLTLHAMAVQPVLRRAAELLDGAR